MQDAWYCLGTENMLDVAHMAVCFCQMMGMAEIFPVFNMVIVKDAKTL
ncbi:MAG: hypothetical protein U7126_04650 [Microcoleus sp.]